MYASLHRFDEETFFPHVKESGPEFVGRDAGKGYNINVAWNLLTKEEHKAKKQPKRCTCEVIQPAETRNTFTLSNDYCCPSSGSINLR